MALDKYRVLTVNLFCHLTLINHGLYFAIVIVLPRSNGHVYICLFVIIENITSGWDIQQSGVVLKTIRYQLVLLSS